MWDPSLYLRFGDQRAQPCLDLIQKIGVADPACAVDLGCGPGNSTTALRARWPRARIIAVDNSPAMLDDARRSDPEVEWIEADIARWRPAQPVDLIFSNAAFQWVPDHRSLLPGLVRCLRASGFLAVQIPYHLHSPAHHAIEELCAEPPWRTWLQPVPRPFEILEPEDYYRILRPMVRGLELWQTTYLHILERPAAIVEWMRGTGLRPYLERIPEAEREAFLRAYGEKVERLFPAQPDGRVLFPFPRLFFVAQV